MRASAETRRSEIWLVSLGASRKGEPGKNRPAIVVSVDELLEGADDELIVVVPLSTSRVASRLRPQVSPNEGIDTSGAAICRAVRAVVRRRLLRRIGKVEPKTLAEVETALAVVLGLDRAFIDPGVESARGSELAAQASRHAEYEELVNAINDDYASVSDKLQRRPLRREWL